jgi:hypothetical protein
MGFVVAAIAVGAVIYWFAGMRKMVCWNNDPRQQQLIQLLIVAGRSGDMVGTCPTDDAAATSAVERAVCTEEGALW